MSVEFAGHTPSVPVAGLPTVPHPSAAPESSAAHGLALVRAPRSRGVYETHVKRPVDVVVAALALLLLLPLLLLISVCVLVQCGRPVLFRQERVGLDGRIFVLYKYRTMREDRRQRSEPWNGEDRRRTHKTDRDPRHTPVGRILRKTSLDELPQLWNVVRGDMSLIGPRPELVALVERYEPWQRRRHDVRPGLTGLWQVSARGGRPMHEVTHIDLEYVDRLSARTDLGILLATPLALLNKTGS
jgi:lipopolysaccharide/colanic/teichoic acid biosynthesis glycosyltransferase